jgi:YebC/PmpR family DNA-binding regulatory protein
MGRAFEYRKARKMKRWGNMARTFTKLSKDITMAVKAGGPEPGANSRLRLLLQNAKAAAMPKDTIERAIKKATDKDFSDYKEVCYDGYGPHGVAIKVETTTDNTTRTVANVRACFGKCGGSLGNIGSLDFMFERKCVFKVLDKNNVDLEELELELIDFNVDEIFKDDEGKIVASGEVSQFGAIQKYFEENGFEIESAEFEYFPTDTKEITTEQQADIDKLLARLYEDEDVTNVFHNIKNSDEE